MDPQVVISVAKYIGAALALFSMGHVAIGISKIFSALLSEMSRNPNMKKELFSNALVGAALAESIALYILVISLMILFM